MRWIDVLTSSLSNLLRRKLRSALTMLGVVLGTAAIIVTISLGYGAEKAAMDQMEANTDLKVITVYPYSGGYGGSMEDSSATAGPRRRTTKITNSIIQEIRAIDNVAAVSPVVYFWGEFKIKIGKLEHPWGLQITGVFPKDFAKMVELTDGKYFTSTSDRFDVIMTRMTLLEYTNPKDRKAKVFDTWEYMAAHPGEGLPLPEGINILTAKTEAEFAYYDSEKTDSDGVPERISKPLKARIVGIADPNSSWGSGFDSTSTYVSMNWLRKFERENRALLKDSGFDSKTLSNYQTVYVKAANVDAVQDILNELREIGVNFSSPMDWINDIKKTTATMQAFFGFIGAISMMVAALSIANTMMMSINERTREIGVMKVLGCKLGNIRLLFLIEAAYIGLFGGGMGLSVSMGLSYALNNVAWLQSMVSSVVGSGGSMFGGPSTVSIIPTSLAAGTWSAVILISVLSGFYPAQRAMRLSSLAAIRNTE